VSEIHLWGVRQNNLKNIEVKVPLNKITVICGPSGSGKSSLAFETLFAEGQRRFIESMSNYSRQFLNKAPKPDLDGISQIPPAVALEQKNSVKSSRSTVGTTTEIVEYIRLLFEKLAVCYCPIHNEPTIRHSPTEAVSEAISRWNGKRGYVMFEVSLKSKPQKAKKTAFKFKGKSKKTTSDLIAADASEEINILGQILADSFLRIMNKDGEIIELTPKTKLPSESFYVIVDRLKFSSDEKDRLYDSVSTAYQMSLKYNLSANKRCILKTTDLDTLIVSDTESCPICEYTPPTKTSTLFSFNSPTGACSECKGFGNVLGLDKQKVIPDPKKSIKQGALVPFAMPSAQQDLAALLKFCRKEGISVDKPWQDLSSDQQTLLWEGGKGFFGVVGLFAYLEEMKYKMHVRIFIARFRSGSVCPKCKGSRLRPDSLNFKVHKKNVAELCEMKISELSHFFNTTPWSMYEKQVALELLEQANSRLNFLIQVGVHYLTLNRETRSLSGGEYQRLLLSNQIGMGLSQVLYVLDEPTVGLHPRDNERLIKTLQSLRDLENTIVLVEHDPELILAADQVIEMGPGSGHRGGEIMFSGLKADFLKSKNSITVPYLNKNNGLTNVYTPRPIDLKSQQSKLTLVGAKGFNLKNITVDFPLNRLVTVTGVSGSGKSSLITKTLYPALAAQMGVEYLPTLPFDKLIGADVLKNVVLVDQSSVGRTERSSPVTYMKIFDAVRSLFAGVQESKIRGYAPGTFSLNVDGGRCVACRGTGYEEIDMQFMDNVLVPCDVCDGKKFQKEILEIKYKDKNIDEVLRMTVAEAMEFFVAVPEIRKPLNVLKEVGLEYLQIGQSSVTLSGGESQRLKIAKELSHQKNKSTLYILDEPTTGLHFREVQLLMNVLHRLIEAGGSVIVVEHNIDVIKGSDYVIDIGPEASDLGGRVVAAGTPASIAGEVGSITGQYL
jgi:excinuclease ABC subunit A